MTTLSYVVEGEVYHYIIKPNALKFKNDNKK